jgi:hypothetical protein
LPNVVVTQDLGIIPKTQFRTTLVLFRDGESRGKAGCLVGIRAGAGAVASMGTAVLLAVLGLTGPASGAPVASVDGVSANGGAVIIVLKNQHDTGQFAALNASREGVVHVEQNGVLAAVHAQGGTNVRQLVSVNAIAANLSPGAVAALRANPAVAEIQPDARVSILGVPQEAAGAKAISPKICPTDPAKPMLEPEALTVTHTDQAWATATGKGVTVAIDGMNDLAGNPNLIRQDGFAGDDRRTALHLLGRLSREKRALPRGPASGYCLLLLVGSTTRITRRGASLGGSVMSMP